MRQIILSFSLLLLISLNTAAQNDPAAIKVLDKFSENALSAPSVSMKFDLITVDQMENTTDTISGSVILSKDKYRLDLPHNITWFDGTTSWSLLTAEKEVTITRPDKKDNSFQSRPSTIFSMYKKGYKSKLIEEKSDLYIIDLYPEDIKSDLLRVRLSIGKSLMNLRSLEYKKRDGVVITLVVKDFNLKIKPEPDNFIFQPAKYKGVDINDMR